MLLILLTIATLFSSINADSVCDERLLIMELKQDLEDNGMLDCLREIQPPQGYEETMLETNKRIAAQWDTQCSFEAEYDWKKPLRELHGISNLVDGVGDIVENDFEDQADMCEIIRAGIASGKLKKITADLINIPLKILDYVDCAGEPEQSEICAVTGSSFFQKDTWYILLDGLSLSIDNKPQFIIEPAESQMPEIPEVQKDIIKKLEGPVTGDPNQLVTDIGSDLSKNAGKLKGAFGEVKDELKKMFKTQASSEAPKSVRDVDRTKIVNIEEFPCMLNNPSNMWNPVNQLVLKIPFDDEKVVLGFTNVIVKYEEPCTIVTRTTFNKNEMLETRSSIGSSVMGAMPTVFLSKARKGDRKQMVEFKTKCKFAKKKLCPDEMDTMNFYTAVLLLDKDRKFFKKMVSTDMVLEKTDKDKKFPELEIDFKLEKEWPILIIYNIALENADTSINILLEIDKTKRPKSAMYRAKADPKATLTGFWAGIVKAGKHKAILYYTANQEIPFDPTINDEKTGSMSILELPLGTVIHTMELGKIANLYQGAWLAMPNMNMNLDFDTDKNLILIFHISLNVKYDKNAEEKLPFMARVKIDGKEIIQSRSSSTVSTVITCVGASLVAVSGGQHNIELEYQAGGKWKIDPENKDKGATLTIVVMDQ